MNISCQMSNRCPNCGLGLVHGYCYRCGDESDPLIGDEPITLSSFWWGVAQAKAKEFYLVWEKPGEFNEPKFHPCEECLMPEHEGDCQLIDLAAANTIKEYKR